MWKNDVHYYCVRCGSEKPMPEEFLCETCWDRAGRKPRQHGCSRPAISNQRQLTRRDIQREDPPPSWDDIVRCYEEG